MHEIAEMELKGNLEGMSIDEYWLNKEVEQENNIVKVTQTLLDKAKLYVEYVKNRTEELKGKLLIEEKVFVDEIHEAIWGTSDAIILAKNKICVMLAERYL